MATLAAKLSRRSAALTRQQRLNAFLVLVLAFVSLVVIFPVIYAIFTSFKPRGFGLARDLLAGGFYLGHYELLFSTPRFVRQIFNSFVMSFGGGVITTVSAAMAGYAFGRFSFRGRVFLLSILLAVMMLPGLTNLIPLYRIASDLDLRDTYIIMILVYAAYGIPFGTWVMVGFFRGIPTDLEEAAKVDGATPFQAFWFVVLPLSAPGLTAVFITNFVYNWNDFLAALVLLSSTAMKTAMVGLFDFQNQLTGNNNELLVAACVLIMMPGVVLFVLFRKAFLRGMLEGALKG
ncbi:MAG: carbohydrate ABC transporter permease [Anaerolineae bacterium]|nr:carbohydrate ABC transporter permease [Thermoflexales bacterium]MDW8293420.1 carbohydrate ABC transporter permease [Anaerolineae bacterium]